MAILPSPFHIASSDWLCSNSNFLSFPSKPVRSSVHRPFLVTFSYKPKKGVVNSDKKREFLEKYGLNPDEFLPEPSPKTKRRREHGNAGMKNLIPLEESKPPRETHKLLQVLGGTARRKKLLSPKGMDVRPMMEVVKEQLFGIFAGSVGIEAISRGCSEVHFVEMDPWVISDVLRPNLESTGFVDVSVIHSVRVEIFLQNSERFVGKDGVFDYISVTPPYMLVDYAVLMDQISSSSVVGENTFIVVEYPLRTDMLDSYASLVKVADRRFGRTQLAIYGPKWAQKKTPVILQLKFSLFARQCNNFDEITLLSIK
ncbi:hypothetical protein Salat_2183600 [Sesamum alatum]|uniref:Uncharacterized protein n=1 Tax=Sesamum alatum TaxID=300844 RepID=A0AAE2CD28_9LAMI|nr:hypothetical protein Salat_2183600 [Sesamum alatum]